MKYFGHLLEFPYHGDINQWFKIAFVFADLTYLPYCFMAVILFSQRNFRFKNIVLLFLQLIPAYTLYGMFRENGIFEFKRMIFPISCYFISWILLLIDFSLIKLISKKIIRFLIWMGGISYGTYIIHIPVLIFFNKISFFSGSAFTFSIRVLLYFLSTFLMAYFLEYSYQNWILNVLQNKKVILLKNSIKSSFKKR